MRSHALAFLVLAACAAEPPPPTPAAPPDGAPIDAHGPAAPDIEAAPRARPRMPITGGGLLTLMASAGNRVAVAQADTDEVHVVDLDSARIERTFPLSPGDAPRRLAELPDGRIAVTLARAGIALLSPSDGAIERIATCALPRGLAYDAGRDRLLVACREGVLAEVPMATRTVSRRVVLSVDLRDVVSAGGRVYVTRFKSAEVILLDRELNVLRQVAMAPAERRDRAAVAYRAALAPDGALYVLHQLAHTNANGPHTAATAVSSGRPDTQPTDPTSGPLDGDPVVVDPGEGESDGEGDDEPTTSYSQDSTGPCERSVVVPAISRVNVDGEVAPAFAITRGTLAVDLAVTTDRVAIADAGARFRSKGEPVRMFHEEMLATGEVACGNFDIEVFGFTLDPAIDHRLAPLVAVAFATDGSRVTLTTGPAMLRWGMRSLALTPTEARTTGFRIFHEDAGGLVACASCHPEGEDDGLVWQLPVARRTPSLAGGLAATAPFHWAGDLPDMSALAGEVFTRRMGGRTLEAAEVEALAAWLEQVPPVAVPTTIEPEATARGAVVYRAACAHCHDTPPAESIDVGTGGALQTPLLRGVMFRAPYLHDGCAQTMADRFGRCATPGHGDPLDAAATADLLRYLETL